MTFKSPPTDFDNFNLRKNYVGRRYEDCRDTYLKKNKDDIRDYFSL